MRCAIVALLVLAATPALAKPPAWDRKIDSPKRFKVLKAFDSEAVLDQETGLVWQREPETVAAPWGLSYDACVLATIGGRGGWRLPTAAELLSLLPAGGDALPAGHPFSASNGFYWSSTSVPDDLSFAYVGDLEPGASELYAPKASQRKIWCVRGAPVE